MCAPAACMTAGLLANEGSVGRVSVLRERERVEGEGEWEVDEVVGCFDGMGLMAWWVRFVCLLRDWIVVVEAGLRSECISASSLS